MNIDEEYADKKKKKESELCQQLITQCEDKQSIYQKGMPILSLNTHPDEKTFSGGRSRTAEATIRSAECRYSSNIINQWHWEEGDSHSDYPRPFRYLTYRRWNSSKRLFLSPRLHLRPIMWTTDQWDDLFSLFIEYVRLAEWAEALSPIIRQYSHEVSSSNWECKNTIVLKTMVAEE